MLGWGSSDDEVPNALTEKEAENSLRLTDFVTQEARAALKARAFTVAPALILELNRIAMVDVIDSAGSVRTTDKKTPILGSRHQPPPFAEVEKYLGSMCAFINETRPSFPADDDPKLRAALDAGIFIASYAIWRLNWIHPFEDGNGRTSRALGYLILSVHSGMFDTASPALPARICREKQKFYRCLDAADIAHKKKQRIRIQQLEDFVRKHYLLQLNEALDRSTRPRPEAPSCAGPVLSS